MTAATEPNEPGADATARSARLRHLIITVYGLYARHDGGWLSVATLIRLLAWGVPYPLLLGTFVAFLDLIPVIGSTVGGIVVSLVALTVSLPVALGTLGFYVFYRLAEDYLIVPRIQGRTVELPALASLVAVLIGGVLLGIVGVLVAIPVAAAIRLLLQEVAFPRLDKS